MRGLLLAKESEVNSLIILGHSMVIIKSMLGKYFLVDRNIAIVISQAKKCWLWSMFIFLIQRSLFLVVFIPHEDFTPRKNVHSSTWGSAGGLPPYGVRGGYPPVMESGGKRAPGGGLGTVSLDGG